MSMYRRISAYVAVAATLQLVLPAFAAENAALSLLAPSSETNNAAQANGPAQAAFDKLVDEYFAAGFKTHPNWGTELGFHEYDSQMPDLSATAIAQRAADLKTFLSRFNAIDPQSLSKTARIDRQMLINSANAEILDIESIKDWKRDPDAYASRISSSVFSLMKRNFASPEERLRNVIEREKAAPRILQSARENLESTPKIYTEIALEQLPGTIDFFEKQVPEAFKSVTDAELLKRFQATNAATIKELKDYQTYLKEQVLPKSVAQFAIGRENYQKKLLYGEMVDDNVDVLLANGFSELYRLQDEFAKVAKKIDPSKTPQQVFAQISAKHPKPDELMPAVRGVLSDLRERSKAVVTLPSEDTLLVSETPPFERATTFASMDAPGPFETKAKEAYYFVTLPEKNWDAKHTEEHMRFYCTQDLINTGVHETYPGHYVQGLWVKQAPSKTRKILGCGTNVEGWAHYCEEMMADRQPNNLQLKLTQLHDALLRCCRYIAGIQMHTQGMSMEDAKQLFITEGYQEPSNAEREAKRGTGDPTYLVYTLGKLQILALRKEYEQQKGKAFNLKQFHDAFLAEGMAPIKLIRTAMLQ